MKKHKEDLTDIMCLDIFLAPVSAKGYKKTKSLIKNPVRKPYPLMSRDLDAFDEEIFLQVKREQELKTLFQFYKKYDWKIDLEAILHKDYEALVLTDSTQKIQWVSHGFKKMTGYDLEFPIGKTPSFLQGKNTSKNTLKHIKEQLFSNESFTEKIINYRKNKEEYLCEVTLYPLNNSQNILTHFLALEKEII